ncbi:MAG TPA: ANTAR domain-containing protein [Sporichthyaceae bacterium]|jgi:AmiR/NasT family two-component response regulator
MTQETDRLLEAMRTRLAGIASSLDDLEQRRAVVMGAAAAQGDRVSAYSRVDGLRTRLEEAEAELDGLRIAMANRGVIERAKGMLMVRLSVDEDAAFEHLREASMRLNRRVADVAADVVSSRAGADVMS